MNTPKRQHHFQPHESFPAPQPDGDEDYARLYESHAALDKMVDELLNHCPICECSKCAEIVCPYGEPMHLHHDGCPACAFEGEAPEVAPAQKIEPAPCDGCDGWGFYLREGSTVPIPCIHCQPSQPSPTPASAFGRGVAE